MIDYRTEVVKLTLQLNDYLNVSQIVEALNSIDRYLVKYNKIDKKGKVNEAVFDYIVTTILYDYYI